MTTAKQWERLYDQTSLRDVPFHFANIRNSPFTLQYLTTILRLCPRGVRTCETGVGNGFASVWLSLRGIHATGIDNAPRIVERAKLINNMLGGQATFQTGDLFHLFDPKLPRFHVIHHQGVLEHFTAPFIQAALAQQAAMAERVVFSVPSVYYPFEPEMGDERLLPLEEWERLLAPFAIEELRYYGDPQHGEREHILCVLRGQPADKKLLDLMQVSQTPYPEGVSAIVHTRNEARQIGECLKTLQGWTDEIIVCDMESEDDTVALARQFTDQILSHPRIANFDRARNVSALRARYRWVFYLDADERVPPGLGPALRSLVAAQGDTFEAVRIPFRHHFAGHWMQSLYPGYTSPRLFKNGKFLFSTRLHAGAQVDGRVVNFPANNPDLALVHYSYDSLSHYLDKLNRYTDGEAFNMHRDGQSFQWQNAIQHFVQDFQSYYDQMGAPRDGGHGFIYSFLSAFYRFEQHAKLYERRFREGALQPQEQTVPASVEQMLEYALHFARQKPLPQAPELPVNEQAPDASHVVWSGPLLDPSGYGEESRHQAFALREAGVPLTVQPIPWSQDEADLTALERKLLQDMAERAAAPGFLQIVHNFASHFVRHPQAGTVIGRTVFETDRLPQEWVKACNRMDYVWVPTEFNQQTFAGAGVAPEKLVVIPECFDPAPYARPAERTARIAQIIGREGFVFLSVFDWTRHKGWDVALRAFLEAFEGREDVTLLLKVWSTMGYSAAQIQAQATEFVRQTLGHDLRADSRVRFVPERLTRAEMIALYQSANAYVLPSRGEGWGRPYMEAMACGLPVIATNWSGNTAFMNQENSYLIDYTLEAVPEAGWQEIPTYRGHRWAEPDRTHLKAQMQRVVEERGEAAQIGRRAQEEVAAQFNRETVGARMAREIARLQEGRRPHLIMVGDSQEQAAGQRAPSSASSTSKRREQPIRVRWEGTQLAWHSLAYVNRELCLRLANREYVELSLAPFEPNAFGPEEDPRFARLEERAFAPLTGPADVHVRHFFPPRFDLPEEGHFALIQPWEYGYLPIRWIEPILNHVSEVWCYSRYVQEVYRASGIPEERLHVTPLGVEPTVFRPDAPPFVFTTEPGAAALQRSERKRFVFLFVGGTLHRKGIDILLDAYLRAFSACDDVSLVIKDTGTQTVYRGQNERERILALTQDATRPPIVYLENDLTMHQLAGVYTACDCLAQPYRGEGFCLPALEALACGLPVIVPEGGPTDDFVDETVGWRVPAEKRPYGNGRIGEWDCVDTPVAFEVAVETLARQMRSVYCSQEEAKKRGHAGTERAHTHWTWEQACDVLSIRLASLRERPQPVRRFSLMLSAPAQKEATEPEAAEETQTESGLQIVDRRSSAKGRKAGKKIGQAPHPAPCARAMPTISLCMIVKNEERVLGDCLTSVKPWVDEIIVVDTGSTDRTVEIASEAGAKVFHFPWRDDFSAARNISLSHATCDWLYWMDADDTLPAHCGEKLHEAVFLAEDRTTGMMMEVHIPPAPGETGFTIVHHVKLFRNDPRLRFEGRIHEQILESIHRINGGVEKTNLYVVHSGYDYSPEGQRRKRERDLTILEKELQERPDYPFGHYCFGMTLFHLKDFDRAIPALEHCLAISKPYESTVRKAYAMLAGCHLEQGAPAQAKTTLEKGLSLTPNDPELLFRAGIVYRELGDSASAERSYVKLLTARESGHIDSLDVTMTTFKAHHNLAIIYQEQGKWKEAENQWLAALNDSPSFSPSWAGLGELYLRQRRFDDARAVVRQLEPLAAPLAEGLRQRLAGMTGSGD